MTSPAEFDAFSDEMLKIANALTRWAARQHGKAQAAFKAGNPEEGAALLGKIDEIAKTPGALKPTAAGRQLNIRGVGGRGSEGVVNPVVDSEFGLAARKLYDPQGISSKELIKRKDVAGKALGKNKEVAEYYGQRATPQGDGTMQFSELVPSAPGSSSRAIARSPDYQAAKDNAAAAYKKHTPYAEPQDVRAANMIRDARTGKLRTVDAIPGKTDEFLPQNMRKGLGIPENQLASMSDAGAALTQNTGIQSLPTGQLQSSMLGKGSPRPNVTSQPLPSQVGTVPNSPKPRAAPKTEDSLFGTPRPLIPPKPRTMPAQKVTVPSRPPQMTGAEARTSVGRRPASARFPTRPSMGPAQAMAPKTSRGAVHPSAMNSMMRGVPGYTPQ